MIAVQHTHDRARCRKERDTADYHACTTCVAICKKKWTAEKEEKGKAYEEIRRFLFNSGEARAKEPHMASINAPPDSHTFSISYTCNGLMCTETILMGSLHHWGAY